MQLFDNCLLPNTITQSPLITTDSAFANTDRQQPLLLPQQTLAKPLQECRCTKAVAQTVAQKPLKYVPLSPIALVVGTYQRCMLRNHSCTSCPHTAIAQWPARAMTKGTLHSFVNGSPGRSCAALSVTSSASTSGSVLTRSATRNCPLDSVPRCK
jgi:hypothetical protein